MRIALTLAVSLFAAVPQSAGAALLTPADLYKIVSVAEPAYSPDGTKIVAVERRVDVAGDKRRSTLVVTASMRPTASIPRT